MKRIVGGRRYDTDKSEVIVSRTCNEGSPDAYCLDLCRGQGGAFFLSRHGEGKASLYRNGDIQALTDKEAMRYLEELNEVEALEKCFGPSIKDA